MSHCVKEKLGVVVPCDTPLGKGPSRSYGTAYSEHAPWWDITRYHPDLSTIFIVGLACILACVVLYNTFFTIRQKHAGVIERFGKFQRVVHPGLHVKVPFIERVAVTASLAVHEYKFPVLTKTKDAFVSIKVAILYRIDSNRVQRAVYDLHNPDDEVKSYAANIIRSAVPGMTLEELFAGFASTSSGVIHEFSSTVDLSDRSDAAIVRQMNFHLTEYGFRILSVLIEEITLVPEASPATDQVSTGVRSLALATTNPTAEGRDLVHA